MKVYVLYFINTFVPFSILKMFSVDIFIKSALQFIYLTQIEIQIKTVLSWQYILAFEFISTFFLIFSLSFFFFFFLYFNSSSLKL